MDLFLIFVFGISIGSFLNVLIDRIPQNQSIILGRSYCDTCKRQLKWYDLIPFVSSVLLRGKCRYCGSTISFQYPLVELLTGYFLVYLYILIFYSKTSTVYMPQTQLQQMLVFAFDAYIVCTLIVIFFTDIKYGIIPNKITYPSIVITALFMVIFAIMQLQVPLTGLLNPDTSLRISFLNHLYSAIGAFSFFLFLFLATKGRGMGFGDVKFAIWMGLFLGFPRVVEALYIAFLTGAIVSLILVVIGRKKFFGGSIPFGPFLVIGTCVSLFWGGFLSNIILQLSR